MAATISTRSARGGGDEPVPGRKAGEEDFNPLRPWGRRRRDPPHSSGRMRFQPAPPVGAETPRPRTSHLPPEYFNPLRPWGRRPLYTPPEVASGIFQPAPPVGAETTSSGRVEVLNFNFNPLRPWGRRPRPGIWRCRPFYFNPLRPWGRRRRNPVRLVKSLCISTRSARGGGDINSPFHRRAVAYISTRSARGGGDCA